MKRAEADIIVQCLRVQQRISDDSFLLTVLERDLRRLKPAARRTALTELRAMARRVRRERRQRENN